MADNVISVRTSAVLSREMKDWPKKRIAVEGQKLFWLFSGTEKLQKPPDLDLLVSVLLAFLTDKHYTFVLITLHNDEIMISVFSNCNQRFCLRLQTHLL